MKRIHARAGLVGMGMATGFAAALLVAYPRGGESQTGYPSQAQAYAQQDIGRELGQINQKLDSLLQGNRRIVELLNRTWENTRRTR
ncbi:MAG: hypothetical protein WCP22_04945 [Chlamydiota bacterium]